jgi:hypothetical protein
MSPVCKDCRNYVITLPCPHCGGDQAFTERTPNEIKPIIPLDLQETFQEPPLSKNQLNLSNSSSTQSTLLVRPEAPVKPPQVPPAPFLKSSPPPPPSKPTISSFPPTSDSRQNPLSQEREKTPITTLSHPKPSIPTPKISLDSTNPQVDDQSHFKQIEAQIKRIDSRQNQFDSQYKKIHENVKKIEKKLKRFEKSMKILHKTNQKLESVHKTASKDLKKII